MTANGYPSWKRLVLSSDNPVCVLNENGVYLEANTAAERLLSHDGLTIVGRGLRDVHPPSLADERLAIVQLTLQRNAPVVLRETLGGVRFSSQHHPLTENDPPKVVIYRSSANGAAVPPDSEVIEARVNDYGPLSKLTPREMEVLELIGQGLTGAEIAKHLHRSERTVQTHRISLGRKLGMPNRVELARIAIASGLAPLQSPAKLMADLEAAPKAQVALQHPTLAATA